MSGPILLPYRGIGPAIAPPGAFVVVATRQAVRQPVPTGRAVHCGLRLRRPIGSSSTNFIACGFEAYGSQGGEFHLGGVAPIQLGVVVRKSSTGSEVGVWAAHGFGGDRSGGVTVPHQERVAMLYPSAAA